MAESGLERLRRVLGSQVPSGLCINCINWSPDVKYPQLDGYCVTAFMKTLPESGCLDFSSFEKAFAERRKNHE